jgi:hypothetical protein
MSKSETEKTPTRARKEFTPMKKIHCHEVARTYNNNGNHAQQRFAFTLTGKAGRADNVPHNLAPDVLTYQVKSARATICRGLDLLAYLADDKAEGFAYVTAEGIVYLMDKGEYVAFCLTFATVTRESKKNGGHLKMRLGHETKALLDYLEAHTE